MNYKRFIVAAALILHAALMCHSAVAANSEGQKTVAEAKFLLDTYYGNGGNLQRASVLLNKALARSERDAEAYIQAARLTVMGGHIDREDDRTNTADAYHALLDKALAIDPRNQKAHILKAEAYDLQKDYRREVAELDKAKAYGESDPWLWMGYARFSERFDDHMSAYHFYSKVEALGPGTSLEHRRAYVYALDHLADFGPAPGEPFRLKELANTARRERHPTDAWTLGNFAEKFVYHGMFDDAIVFSREALQTMNYGAARLTLAAALYGKAALLIVEGKQRGDADRLISEAQKLGLNRSDILARLEDSGPQADRLMPTFRQIVK